MSYSSLDVKPQSDRLLNLLSDLPGTMVALLTNKRLIVRCEARRTSETVMDRFTHAGFFCEIAKGRKTQAYYVRAAFNAPY